MHVLEKFDVAALVRGDGHRLGIFVNGAIYNFANTTVVSKMNYFSAGSLNNSAHDVDGSIMSIEQ